MADFPKLPDGLRMVYLGPLVPEGDLARYPAANPAGILFQKRMLDALAENGLPPDAIISARPVPSFPKIPRLWYGSSEAVLDSGFEVDYLPFVNFGPLKTLSAGMVAFFRLLRWGRRQPDGAPLLVLTYNLRVPHAFFLLPAARLVGARMVSVVADIWIPGRGSLLKRLSNAVQTWCMRRLDGVVTLTGRMVEDFAPKVPGMAMNGAISREDFNKLSAVAEQNTGDRDTFTLMYAGSLTEFKTGLLLRAFREMEGDHYRLLISGRGPLEGEVRKLAEEDSRVDYRGFLASYDDVLELYGEADLLLNTQSTDDPTSLYTFPSKIIEYMSTGRPVLATCTAGVREEFSDYLFLLEEESPGRLIELVKRVEGMDPDKRQRISTRARNYVARHKLWERQGSRMADFMAGILGKGR